MGEHDKGPFFSFVARLCQLALPAKCTMSQTPQYLLPARRTTIRRIAEALQLIRS